MHKLPIHTRLPQGTVTLLFTDIEGSTRLLQQLGQEKYAHLLAESRDLLRQAFESWNGEVVDTQGDAFFVAFARAGDAVAAAIEAQRAFATHAFPDNAGVHIRMGIHTGEPELSSAGYIGLDVHRGARIMGAGHGGQVLLSQTTRALVEHDLPQGASIQYLGIYGLKDIADETPLYQLSIAGLPDCFLPLTTRKVQNRLHAFPSQPTPFIGRQPELQAITRLLRCEDVRLLTLVGTAGVGKTRLAAQAATEISDIFSDGIYFVALAQICDVDTVLPAIARALGVREESNRVLLDLVQEAVQEKSLLLVLDNVEQVISASTMLAELLAHCPLLKMLVTSREVLHIQAENIFEVRPFTVPNLKHLPPANELRDYASITLFVQRAQAARPDFHIDIANARAIVKICARLDGIPLAIELAGARIKYLTPQALLTQLDRELVGLKGSARDAPARQQTLRNAIAWSYDLLDVEQQRLFRRLAVFTGSWTAEAAERVRFAEDERDGTVLEELEALVDKSLLRLEEQAQDEQRFSMLQTLREYGLERLTAAGELEATQEAHAAYYLAEVEKIAPLLEKGEAAYWLDRLEQEHKNLQAALSWLLERARSESAYAERALRFCVALTDFWEVRSYFQEARAFTERLVAVSEVDKPSLRAEALHQAGFLALIQDDMRLSEQIVQESLTLFAMLGDRLSTAKVLRTTAQVKMMTQTTEARRLMERAFALFQELGDVDWSMHTRSDIGRIATMQGDYAKACAFLREAIADYVAGGSAYRYHRAYPLVFLARALLLSGKDGEQAQALAEESLALFKEIGNQRFAAYTLNVLGRIALHNHALEQAQQLCEESMRLFDEICHRLGVAESLISLAQIKTQQGNLTAAQSDYARCWELLLRAPDAKELYASCLEGWGELLARQGQLEQAVQCWAVAAGLRASLVAPMPPIYRPAYTQALAIARDLLGQQAFQAAWQEGRKLTPAQIHVGGALEA